MVAVAMAVVVSKEMALARRMTVRTRMTGGSCVTSVSPLAAHAAWVVFWEVGAGDSAPSVLAATYMVLLPDTTRGSKTWALK